MPAFSCPLATQMWLFRLLSETSSLLALLIKFNQCLLNLANFYIYGELKPSTFHFSGSYRWTCLEIRRYNKFAFTVFSFVCLIIKDRQFGNSPLPQPHPLGNQLIKHCVSQPYCVGIASSAIKKNPPRPEMLSHAVASTCINQVLSVNVLLDKVNSTTFKVMV